MAFLASGLPVTRCVFSMFSLRKPAVAGHRPADGEKGHFLNHFQFVFIAKTGRRWAPASRRREKSFPCFHCENRPSLGTCQPPAGKVIPRVISSMFSLRELAAARARRPRAPFIILRQCSDWWVNIMNGGVGAGAGANAAQPQRKSSKNAARTRRKRGANAVRARRKRGANAAPTRRRRGANAAQTRCERGANAA